MACLIKDRITGEFVGYQMLSEAEQLQIEKGGDYEVVPFYDKATCRKVLGINGKEEQAL